MTHIPTPINQAIKGLRPKKRQAATTHQGRLNPVLLEFPNDFPVPLILPGDDQAIDPTYPPQSLRSWLRDKNRNQITTERRTIYVAAPPDFESDVSCLRDWVKPKLDGDGLGSPDIEDVVDYNSAFYYGIPVRRLPSTLSFTARSENKTKCKRSDDSPLFVGLNTSTTCVRIRIRPPKDDVFPRQLNLDDPLDTAMEILPSDAYAFNCW